MEEGWEHLQGVGWGRTGKKAGNKRRNNMTNTE